MQAPVRYGHPGCWHTAGTEGPAQAPDTEHVGAWGLPGASHLCSPMAVPPAHTPRRVLKETCQRTQLELLGAAGGDSPLGSGQRLRYLLGLREPSHPQMVSDPFVLVLLSGRFSAVRVRVWALWFFCLEEHVWVFRNLLRGDKFPTDI